MTHGNDTEKAVDPTANAGLTPWLKQGGYASALLEELLAHLSDADIAALWLLIFAWADGRSKEKERPPGAEGDELPDTDYASIYGPGALKARHTVADRAAIAMLRQLEAKFQARAALLEARAEEKK